MDNIGPQSNEIFIKQDFEENSNRSSSSLKILKTNVTALDNGKFSTYTEFSVKHKNGKTETYYIKFPNVSCPNSNATPAEAKRLVKEMINERIKSGDEPVKKTILCAMTHLSATKVTHSEEGLTVHKPGNRREKTIDSFTLENRKDEIDWKLILWKGLNRINQTNKNQLSHQEQAIKDKIPNQKLTFNDLSKIKGYTPRENDEVTSSELKNISKKLQKWQQKKEAYNTAVAFNRSWGIDFEEEDNYDIDIDDDDDDLIFNNNNNDEYDVIDIDDDDIEEIEEEDTQQLELTTAKNFLSSTEDKELYYPIQATGYKLIGGAKVGEFSAQHKKGDASSGIISYLFIKGVLNKKDTGVLYSARKKTIKDTNLNEYQSEQLPKTFLKIQTWHNNLSHQQQQILQQIGFDFGQ